jgi:SAM-dependent methyltransferase
MTGQQQYVLGSSSAERERLLKQARLHEQEARWLLDQTGIRFGWRAIDIGCGPLGIMDLLAERVGPTGHVVGLDREPEMLTVAKDLIAERPLKNVQLVEADGAATGLDRASFDLAHARLVLVNVPNPEQILAEMTALVRPGGVVAVQEVDWLSWTCEPPHPAWDRLREANEAVWRDRGGDVYIGRRLPGLLRAEGLVDVAVKAHVPIWQLADMYQTLLLRFTALHRDAILEAGLLTESEVTSLVEDLRTHLMAPGTMVIYAILFQAWGRRPDA